jgi:hypothetical protein
MTVTAMKIESINPVVTGNLNEPSNLIVTKRQIETCNEIVPPNMIETQLY